MKFCETCGQELVRHPKHSQAQWDAKRFCDRQCAAQRLVIPRFCACGCAETPLRGRKYVPGHRPKKPTADGYIRVWAPDHPLAHSNGMVLEHRKFAFDAGWHVPPGFHVHHRNGVKHDNRLENLEVVSIGNHARLHWDANRPAACPQGHPFTPENTGRLSEGWRYCKTCNRERARRHGAGAAVPGVAGVAP